MPERKGILLTQFESLVVSRSLLTVGRIEPHPSFSLKESLEVIIFSFQENSLSLRESDYAAFDGQSHLHTFECTAFPKNSLKSNLSTN